jgi:hypothetical protein
MQIRNTITHSFRIIVRSSGARDLRWRLTRLRPLARGGIETMQIRERQSPTSFDHQQLRQGPPAGGWTHLRRYRVALRPCRQGNKSPTLRIIAPRAQGQGPWRHTLMVAMREVLRPCRQGNTITHLLSDHRPQLRSKDLLRRAVGHVCGCSAAHNNSAALESTYG